MYKLNINSRNEQLQTNNTIQFTNGSTLFPQKLQNETNYGSKFRSRFKTSSEDIKNWNTIDYPKETCNGAIKVLQELKKTNLNIIKKKAEMTKFFKDRIKILNQYQNKTNSDVPFRKSIKIINEENSHIVFSKAVSPLNKEILRERRKSYLAKRENPKFKIILNKDDMNKNIYWDNHELDSCKKNPEKELEYLQVSKEKFEKEFTLFKTKDGVDFIKNTLNIEKRVTNNLFRNPLKANSTISEFGNKFNPKLSLPVINGRVSLKEMYEKYEKNEIPIPKPLSKTSKNYFNTLNLSKTKSKMNKTQTKNYLLNTESRILSTINIGELASQKKKKIHQQTCFTDQRPFFTKRSLTSPLGDVIGEIYQNQLKLGQVHSNLENTINNEMNKYNHEFEV